MFWCYQNTSKNWIYYETVKYYLAGQSKIEHVDGCCLDIVLNPGDSKFVSILYGKTFGTKDGNIERVVSSSFKPY